MRFDKSPGLVLLIATAWLAGGCSALVSRPPPSSPMRSPSDCNPARWPAVGDVIAAPVFGAVALIGLGNAALLNSHASNESAPSWNTHSDYASEARTSLAVGTVAAAAATGLILSAAYGFRSASLCRRAALAGYWGGWDRVGYDAAR